MVSLNKLVVALYARYSFSKRATGWTASPASIAVAPSQDSFYQFLPESELAKYAPGDVIKSRPVGGFSDYPSVKGYQLVFRSENSHQQPVAALTTILVPQNNNNRHAVVFPQAEDSSSLDCASSHKMLTQGVGGKISQFLQAGYVVNVPDHEGFNSSFSAGILEGKLTLDSIRALEKSRHITDISNDQHVVVGYSGGSIPTGWAAELQASYAPELNIKGYSMGGVVASLVAVMRKVNRTPLVEFVPSSFMGLASEYPELWPIIYQQISPARLGALSQTRRQCTAQNIAQFAFEDFFTNFISGQAVLNDPAVAKVLEANTLGKVVPKAPMFIYNGVEDQIVPVQSVDSVVDFYCANGASVVYRRGTGLDHFSMESGTAPALLQWVGNVFEGQQAAGCSFEGAPQRSGRPV